MPLEITAVPLLALLDTPPRCQRPGASQPRPPARGSEKPNPCLPSSSCVLTEARRISERSAHGSRGVAWPPGVIATLPSGPRGWCATHTGDSSRRVINHQDVFSTGASEDAEHLAARRPHTRSKRLLEASSSSSSAHQSFCPTARPKALGASAHCLIKGFS